MYEKSKYSVIGKSRPRIDVDRQLTGKVQYAGDMQVPGMLYAKGVFSPHDHAKILSVDTAEVMKVPGVRGIATAEDVVFNRLGIYRALITVLKSADLSGEEPICK